MPVVFPLSFSIFIICISRASSLQKFDFALSMPLEDREIYIIITIKYQGILYTVQPKMSTPEFQDTVDREDGTWTIRHNERAKTLLPCLRAWSARRNLPTSRYFSGPRRCPNQVSWIQTQMNCYSF